MKYADNYPWAYMHNPDIQKPLEEIYRDIDSFTWEIQPDEPERLTSLNLCILFPPVYFEGRFLKGLCFSVGVEPLVQFCPDFLDYFYVVAGTGWCSYPWSKSANAYLAGFNNPHREAWFRGENPDRADKILIPLQGAPEFSNEYVMAPVPPAVRDIDIISVSRIHNLKNIPMIAQALKIYRQKYPTPHIRMTLVSGWKYDINHEEFDEHTRGQYRQIEEILTHPNDYIDFIPHLNWYTELPDHYARSKVFVLGSLVEGKNRSMHEAMVCNTPVVCFKEFNQYLRGDDFSIPPGAGMYATYDAESLADTMHHVIHNPEEFTPRKSFLQHFGRKNFLNTCVDRIPYYRENLPDYTLGEHYDNLWLDMAVSRNYQTSLHDFLYGHSVWPNHSQGIEACKSASALIIQTIREAQRNPLLRRKLHA